jgi:hypothetical protein
MVDFDTAERSSASPRGAPRRVDVVELPETPRLATGGCH